MKDEYYKQDAKQIVDMLFDKGYFVPETTRDDMQSIQELIEFLLQSKFDTYKRVSELTKKLKTT